MPVEVSAANVDEADGEDEEVPSNEYPLKWTGTLDNRPGFVFCLIHWRPFVEIDWRMATVRCPNGYYGWQVKYNKKIYNFLSNLYYLNEIKL
jgi:hypothetical protein